MKINKEQFDKLPADLKSAFKVSATNPDEYDNGEESAPELKSALEKERAERAELGKKLAEHDAAKRKEIEAERKKALEEARSSGDFAKIEADYKKQIAGLENQMREDAAKREADLVATALDKEAAALAESFVTPELAIPAIKSRLKGEIVEGKAIVRVLDKNGAASAMSISDLKKEYLTDDKYKGSIVASKASGGGATGAGEDGGAAASNTAATAFDAAAASPRDMIAHLERKGLVSED